jgi:hypothetical protein
MPEPIVARLKPYNPKRGCVLRTYTVMGVTFREGSWYEPPAEVIPIIRNENQIPGDPDTPLAFDVCLKSEARDLVERERQAAAKAEEPDDAVLIDPLAGALTTADLPKNRKKVEPPPANLDDEDEDFDPVEPGASMIPGAPTKGPAKKRPTKGPAKKRPTKKRPTKKG